MVVEGPMSDLIIAGFLELVFSLLSDVHEPDRFPPAPTWGVGHPIHGHENQISNLHDFCSV